MSKFRDYITEAKELAVEFEKLSGIKPEKGGVSTNRPEKVFFFSDKSSLVIYPDKTRMEYYDKNMEFITAYTSVKQAMKAMQQSGLLTESTKITESMDIDEMAEEIAMLNGKGAEIAWEYMEDLSHDLGLYPGDSTPEDYLEKMSDKQIKELYKLVKIYI